MLDAVAGAVIMVVATSSMLYSIEVAERAFSQAGRYPLNSDEKDVLVPAGVLHEVEQDAFWRDNIKDAPREIGLDR